MDQGQPNHRLADDVWDLFREPARLQRVLQAAPLGAMLLVIGGSPCQQLTTASVDHGRLGLCGRDSVLFYSLAATAHVLQRARPDLQVEVLVENAGSILPEFRTAMTKALGIAESTFCLSD